MRTRLPVALACAAIALLVLPGLTSARPAGVAAPRRALCSAAFVDAIVGGEHKCLHAGEFCSARYERDYERYGFGCVAGRLERKGSPTSTPASGATPSHTVPLLRRIRSSGCRVRGPLPDRGCSPGAIFADATLQMICTPGYSSRVRNVPESEKDAVYAEYGIPRSHYGRPYEVDHIVSLELGGSNDIANLWPEAASPTPGFHQKDQVENYLHDQVCSGKIPLQQAQYEIATNWMQVYQQMQQNP